MIGEPQELYVCKYLAKPETQIANSGRDGKQNTSQSPETQQGAETSVGAPANSQETWRAVMIKVLYKQYIKTLGYKPKHMLQEFFAWSVSPLPTRTDP